MAMKVGCAAWTWTEPAHNPPYEGAIKAIGELGFDGVELILRDFEDVECYWTVKKRKEIKSMLDYYGLEVSQFAMFQNVMDGLASLENDRKQKSIDAFKAGCEISAALGCDIVNFVSPWPDTITAPNSYLPEYYYINVPGLCQQFCPHGTFHHLPQRFFQTSATSMSVVISCITRSLLTCLTSMPLFSMATKAAKSIKHRKTRIPNVLTAPVSSSPYSLW